VQLSCRRHYRPESRQLDSECVLPDPDVVPAVRRYRYVPAVDDIRRQFLPEVELRERYADCVAQIAVSALFDLFTCLDPDVVDVVRLDARARVAPYFDVAGPHVLSVVATRQAWTALRPGEQDPLAVLAALGARVSPDPYAGVPVPPHAGLEP
jgi:hypothetical protein